MHDEVSEHDFIARCPVGGVALDRGWGLGIDRYEDVPGRGVVLPGIEGQVAEVLAVLVAELPRSLKERVVGPRLTELDSHLLPLSRRVLEFLSLGPMFRRSAPRDPAGPRVDSEPKRAAG
jgi:hypothetical protein